MAEHKHGSMNIEEHEKTFAAFMSWTQKVVIVVFFILLFLAIFWS